MRQLSGTQLTFLEGFVYLTSLAYSENPGSCNCSVMKASANYMAKILCLFQSMHFFSQCTQQNILKRSFLVSSNLEVIFMPFQKGQLENSLVRLNVGSKSDIKHGTKSKSSVLSFELI